MSRRLRVSPNYYITDKQIGYLRLLLNEAFANLYHHKLCIDPHHISDRMPRTEASAAIGKLLEAKNNGWKAP